MNVKELKEELEGLPDDMEVILQKDGEGNGHSPLSEVSSDYIYIEDTSYSGEVWYTEHSADDNDMEEDEWEEMKENPRVLVLFPVN